MKSPTAAVDRAQREHQRNAKRLRDKTAAEGKRAAKMPRILRRVRGYSGGASRNAGSWNRAGKTISLLFKHHKGSVRGVPYSMKDKTAQHIGSNMLSLAPLQLVEEFKLDCLRYPMVVPENLIVHISLSRPKGHSLTNDQWHEVGKEWLKNIGAAGCNYTIVRHPGDNDHAHIVYSRIRPDNTLVSDSNDFYRGRASAREAARSLGIEVPDQPPKMTMAPTDRAVNAQRRAQRRGTPSAWIQPEVVQHAVSQARTLAELPALLQAHGIEFKLSTSISGSGQVTVTGVLMRAQGADEWLAGSSINRNFSLPAIQRQIELNAQRANGVTPQRPPTPIPSMRPVPTQIQAPRQRGG